MRKLAILGGPSAAPERIPINQPTLPRLDQLSAPLEKILESAQVTDGRYARELEERAQEICGVKHAIAVSNCTAGLMLGIQALGLKKRRVVLPSFTFPATAHVLSWNRLEPVFADCEESTFNLDPESARKTMDEETGAIVGVPIFGNPVQGPRILRLAKRARVPVIYDAAHALGARNHDQPISTFATLSVFSLAPSKLVSAGEGGIVATDDDELARRVRVGRNYGNPGNYDCEFAGLNARMSEFHAVLGLFGLERLEMAIERRTAAVQHYRDLLGAVPGIRFQEVQPGDRCTYNYFALVLDPEAFGLTSSELLQALEAENIGSRRYFHPPLHRQRIYAGEEMHNGSLRTTDEVSNQVLCLPLFTHMETSQIEKVCEVIADIQRQAVAVRDSLTGASTRSAGGAP
jgi:dTDP-4-amino-4,6-dideoxygalactose transaminase